MADLTRRGFLNTTLGVGAAAGVLSIPIRGIAEDDGGFSESGGAVEQPEGSAPEFKNARVSFTCNGETIRLDAGPWDSALSMVRDQLGLTGPKLGCGQGACGACAIELDGIPVSACLLPATALEGKSVRTVEGFGVGELHPIQRAFVAYDAMQCGFCTPGFVTESVALYDRYKADLAVYEASSEDVTLDTDVLVAPPSPPDAEAVKAALAGHLCRCGAYQQIIGAVVAACAGDFDPVPLSQGDPVELEDEAPLDVPDLDASEDALGVPELDEPAEGEPTDSASVDVAGVERDEVWPDPGYSEPIGPRVDAVAKVTGEARYTVDVQLDGTLVGRIFRSPHAHAGIVALDVTPALKVPGVSAVVALMKAGDTVRFCGQEVAAVAGVNEHAVREGMAAIAVTWDARRAAVGMDQALAKDAPEVFDIERSTAPNANELPLLPTAWRGNLRGPFRSSFLMKPYKATEAISAAEAGGPEAGVMVSARFETQTQSHSALEPHGCVAEWKGDKLTVYLSTQNCTGMAEDLAKHFKVKENDLRVLCEYVGGGFGAKCTLQMEARAAVSLARTAGKPVRVVYDREEEILNGGTRPGSRQDVTLVADKDGSFQAMKVHCLNDSGMAVGSAVGFMYRLMYRGSANKVLHDFDVLNFAPPSRPFRGPGGPPAFWALEQTVDELAAKLALDPLDLRRKWERDDPHDANRLRLYDWAASLPIYKDRDALRSETGRYRRGVGVAAATWFHIVAPDTEVQLKATSDGRFHVSTAVQDMGQGARTVLVTEVAHALGVPPTAIDVNVGDSHLVKGSMSAGSRTTNAVVDPCRDAAAQLTTAMVDRARLRFGLTGAEAAPGGVSHDRGFVPWASVLADQPAITCLGKRAGDEGGYTILGGPDGKIGKGTSYVVQVTEVEVDTRLGRIRVPRTWTGVSCGRIVVPELARNQVCGGVVQGVGYALYEDRRLDPNTGRLLTAGLEDYRIAGIGDAPKMVVHFDEEGFDHVPGRAIGVGEICTVAVAGSIGNAVAHATGTRYRTLPLRPDRILAGLNPAA